MPRIALLDSRICPPNCLVGQTIVVCRLSERASRSESVRLRLKCSGHFQLTALTEKFCLRLRCFIGQAIVLRGLSSPRAGVSLNDAESHS